MKENKITELKDNEVEAVTGGIGNFEQYSGSLVTNIQPSDSPDDSSLG